MPVLLHASTHDERSGRFVKIGLINNMPDEALEATERQFISLLDLASEGMPIHWLYTPCRVFPVMMRAAVTWAASTRTSKISGKVISMG